MDAPKAVCRVCKKEEIYHVNATGVKLMPRTWSLHEDKTPDRGKSMAEVCSDNCIRRLKEMNKTANNNRTGW